MKFNSYNLKYLIPIFLYALLVMLFTSILLVHMHNKNITDILQFSEQCLVFVKVLSLSFSILTSLFLFNIFFKDPFYSFLATHIILALFFLLPYSWLVYFLFSIIVLFVFVLKKYKVFNIEKANYFKLVSILFSSILLPFIVIKATFLLRTDIKIDTLIEQMGVHKDTLMHIAFAESVQNYGIGSTGLHGVIKRQYHFLSHFQYGFLSKFIGERIFIGYGYFSSLVFFPIFIFTLLNIASRLTPLLHGKFSYILFLLPLAFFSSFFGFVFDTFLISESQLVSLIYFLEFIFFIFQKYILNYRSSNRFLISILSLFFIFILFLLKIATGFITLSIFLFILFYSFWKSKDISILFVILLAAIVGYIGVNTVRDLEGSGKTGFLWGSFRKDYFESTSNFTFLLFHFFNYWIVFLFLIINYYYKRHTTNDLILFLIFTITTMIGFVALNLEIPGGSAFHFSSISLILSFWILPNLVKSFYFQKKMIIALLIFLTLIYTVSAGQYFSITYDKIKKMRESNLSLSFNLEKNFYIQSLRNIYKESRENVKYMVYIPKKETKFWGDESNEFLCTSRPFYILGVSGLPAIFGLPSRKCNPMYYGYNAYSSSLFEESETLEISHNRICEEINKNNFLGYYKIENDSFQKYNCN